MAAIQLRSVRIAVTFSAAPSLAATLRGRLRLPQVSQQRRRQQEKQDTAAGAVSAFAMMALQT